METTITFNIDDKAATIFIMKTFDAEVEEVWKHFTEADLLDQWWAPKPWKCETLEMDFQPQGFWRYAMVGPENERHYSKVTFNDITFHRSISQRCTFTDESGNEKPGMPAENWLIGFTGVQEGTKLTVNLHYHSLEEMTKMLEMGFEGGFKRGLNQLEEILNKKRPVF